MKLPNARSLKKYVKEIKGEVKQKDYFTQIFDLFLEYKKLFMNQKTKIENTKVH